METKFFSILKPRVHSSRTCWFPSTLHKLPLARLAQHLCQTSPPQHPQHRSPHNTFARPCHRTLDSLHSTCTALPDLATALRIAASTSLPFTCDEHVTLAHCQTSPPHYLFFCSDGRLCSEARSCELCDLLADQRGFEPPPVVCQRRQERRDTN